MLPFYRAARIMSTLDGLIFPPDWSILIDRIDYPNLMGSNHPLSVRTERRMDKQEIRDKSSQDNSNILLLEKGKRGALNVIFGRTMLIVVLILAQTLLLFLAFRSFREYTP